MDNVIMLNKQRSQAIKLIVSQLKYFWNVYIFLGFNSALGIAVILLNRPCKYFNIKTYFAEEEQINWTSDRTSFLVCLKTRHSSFLTSFNISAQIDQQVDKEERIAMINPTSAVQCRVFEMKLVEKSICGNGCNFSKPYCHF